MSLFIKICGINSKVALDAAISAGADAVGFVFAPSARRVTSELARELAASVPRSVVRVGVFKHPSIEHVREVARDVPLDLYQADALDEPVFMAQNLTFLPVYRDAHDLSDHLRRETEDRSRPRRILIEGPTSGVGQIPEWSRIAAVAHALDFILAGGLTPANVAQAIAACHPSGVDVSSGVESASGVKDPNLIRAFIAAARAAS